MKKVIFTVILGGIAAIIGAVAAMIYGMWMWALGLVTGSNVERSHTSEQEAAEPKPEVEEL